VEGTFALHGVSRRIRIAVEVTYHPVPAPGRIEFHTEFPVALADYGIERPQFLFLKLAEIQTVRVSGVAVGMPALANAPPTAP
jgi:polyisoprenoid-binding protein YceI